MAITITQQPTSVSAYLNGALTFTIAATGATSYAWEFCYKDTTGFSPIDGATTETLKLTMLEDYDGAQVRCKVSDGKTTATSDAATITLLATDGGYIQTIDVNVDINPKYGAEAVSVSQNDDTLRLLVFSLYNNLSPFTIPDGATVRFSGYKSDGNIFDYQCETKDNTAYLLVQKQMTAIAGIVDCKLQIVKNGGQLATCLIQMIVDEDPTANGVVSESVLSQVEQINTNMRVSYAHREAAKEYADNSQTSAENSEKSAVNSANSASAAKTSETNAAGSATDSKNSANSSASSAKLSESWAIGGTGTRNNENTDNSKYYSQRSANSASAASLSATDAATQADRAEAAVAKMGSLSTSFYINASGHLMYGTIPNFAGTFAITSSTGHLHVTY